MCARGRQDYRVVVIPPLGHAYSTFISGGSDETSAVVDGMVEVVPTCPHFRTDTDLHEIEMWCNEEFLYRDDLPFNRAIIDEDGHRTLVFGPILVDAINWPDGRSVGLTSEERDAVLQDIYLREPQILCYDPDMGSYTELTCSQGPASLYHTLALLSDAEREYSRTPAGPEPTCWPIVGKPEQILVRSWVVTIHWNDDDLDASEVEIRHKTDQERSCTIDLLSDEVPMLSSEEASIVRAFMRGSLDASRRGFAVSYGLPSPVRRAEAASRVAGTAGEWSLHDGRRQSI